MLSNTLRALFLLSTKNAVQKILSMLIITSSLKSRR